MYLAGGVLVAGLCVALFAISWFNPAIRISTIYLALATGWIATCLSLYFCHLRLPVVIAEDCCSAARLRGTLSLRLPLVLEARWSIRFRHPTLLVRTSKARYLIKFAEYELPDQLLLIRYFRQYLPARAHRDWYRFCRYALFIRRRVVDDLRDERTPRQRRWDAIFHWIGVTTESVLIGMFSRDAGQMHMNRAVNESIAKNAIPHEAFSDSEPEERWFEASAVIAALIALILPVVAYFVAGWWSTGILAGIPLLMAWSLFAWRKQAQFEEELALDTADDVMRRWDIGEGKRVF
jgi:hypothetical protein